MNKLEKQNKLIKEAREVMNKSKGELASFTRTLYNASTRNEILTEFRIHAIDAKIGKIVSDTCDSCPSFPSQKEQDKMIRSVKSSINGWINIASKVTGLERGSAKVKIIYAKN